MRSLGGTYVRTDGRTDVRKFTPVSYRTSALWGLCPKRRNGRMARRKECKEGRKVGIEGKKRERKEGKNGKKGGMERIE